MNLQNLRVATAANHKAVETLFPLSGNSLTPETYAQYLQRLRGLVAAWEGRPTHTLPAWLVSMQVARSRLALLERDLAWFDCCGDDCRQPALPEAQSVASVVGQMYDMEGMTLGGQILGRLVQLKLGLTAGNGNAYFRGHQERTRDLWTEFCVAAEARIPDGETDAVTTSAKSMFQVFETWMRPASQ